MEHHGRGIYSGTFSGISSFYEKCKIYQGKLKYITDISSFILRLGAQNINLFIHV